MKQRWYERFEDALFSQYIESGEAEAVWIIRDQVKAVDTSGKWIAILVRDALYAQGNEYHWIAAELFPRITVPEYTTDPEENRHICWHAAHEDINYYREIGHHGPRYMVLYRKVPRRMPFPNTEGYLAYEAILVIAAKHIRQKHLMNPKWCAEQMLTQKNGKMLDKEPILL